MTGISLLIFSAVREVSWVFGVDGGSLCPASIIDGNSEADDNCAVEGSPFGCFSMVPGADGASSKVAGVVDVKASLLDDFSS